MWGAPIESYKVRTCPIKQQRHITPLSLDERPPLIFSRLNAQETWLWKFYRCWVPANSRMLFSNKDLKFNERCFLCQSHGFSALPPRSRFPSSWSICAHFALLGQAKLTAWHEQSGMLTGRHKLIKCWLWYVLMLSTGVVSLVQKLRQRKQ